MSGVREVQQSVKVVAADSGTMASGARLLPGLQSRRTRLIQLQNLRLLQRPLAAFKRTEGHLAREIPAYPRRQGGGVIDRRELFALMLAAAMPPVGDVYAVYRRGRWYRCRSRSDVVQGDRVYVRNSYWKRGVIATCAGWFATRDDLKVDVHGNARGLQQRDPTPCSELSGFVIVGG
jgi:hypothetical protein